MATPSKAKKTMSEKAVKANQANGKQSLGPQGLAILKTRFNAVGLGLTGSHVLLPGEDPAIFAEHVLGFLHTFLPQTYFERRLVERMAQNDWRLQRSANNDKKLNEKARSREQLWKEKLNQSMHEQRLERNILKCMQAFQLCLKLDTALTDRFLTLDTLPVIEVKLAPQDYIPPESWTDLPYDDEEGQAEQAHRRDIAQSLMDSGDRIQALEARLSQQQHKAEAAQVRLENLIQSMHTEIDQVIEGTFTETNFVDAALQAALAMEAQVENRALSQDETMALRQNIRAYWHDLKPQIADYYAYPTWEALCQSRREEPPPQQQEDTG